MKDFFRFLAMRNFVDGDDSGGSGGLRDIIENGWPTPLYDAEATMVAECVFQDSPNIYAIDFPKVGDIGGGAFKNCGNLRSVNLPKAHTIRTQAFNGCTALTELHLPNCEAIFSSAFGDCESLKTVSITHDNLLQISLGAFISCSSLEKVDLRSAPSLPVEEKAFFNCVSLKTIICRDTEKVMVAPYSAISGTPIADFADGAYIYIPASMWDAYTAVYGETMVFFRKIEDYPEICG